MQISKTIIDLRARGLQNVFFNKIVKNIPFTSEFLNGSTFPLIPFGIAIFLKKINERFETVKPNGRTLGHIIL